MSAQLQSLEDDDDVGLASQLEDAGELPSGWVMKKLKPKHKQVASLIAQGFKNVDVAKMLDITPQYVSMLLGQPLVQQYIAEMNLVVGARLEAMFDKTVDVIADAMTNGNHSEKLKGARLHLEATKRIGRPDANANRTDDSVGRLELLSERLLGLLSSQRVKVIEHETTEVIDAEFRDSSSDDGAKTAEGQESEKSPRSQQSEQLGQVENQ